MSERTPANGRATLARRLAGVAVRLYPRAWRARYAAEMLAVLDQQAVTLWTALDVLAGALDARLRRDLRPQGVMALGQRIRTSEIAIFGAFVVFGVGWLAVQRVRDPLPPWEQATAAQPAILWSFDAVQAAGLVAFLALIAGGLPVIASAVKQAYLARRRLAALIAVPFVGLAALALFAWLAAPYAGQTQTPAPNAALTPLALALQLGFLLLFVAAVVGGAAALGLLVARSATSARATRFALWPAAVVTAAMVAGLAAMIVLLTLISVQMPDVVPSDVVDIVILLAVAAAAVAVAVAALRRGLRAARAV